MSSKQLTGPPGDPPSRGFKAHIRFGLTVIAVIGLLLVLFGMASNNSIRARRGLVGDSIAYGSLNNFDCVNDTGVEGHGFEIELDDITSVDISYTYDYNHYGPPKIIEDRSDPSHPRVFVRYESAKNTDGTWAAYTAIPSGPINPTDGHQFTDPSVNFGGEHFGVGFNANPTAVKYNWLIDDGSGNLVHGPPVNVSTPTFNYYPPAGGAAANVVAAIVPPPPPAPPVLQFGDACWTNAIKTTTHNPNKVRLQDLVSDDPGFPDPWANGEPDEVENEWRLMQTNFADPNGGAFGELQGAPEELPDGDEVITRRYEFFKYTGPFDAESGEAMASEVGPDGLHGVGTVTYNDHMENGEWVTVTVDLSTVVVVGEFFGAQMSGFDVAQQLGLIDNLQDGEIDVQYPDRRVVIAGIEPFLAEMTDGSLPQGMTFDAVNGVLSGTPVESGAFTFTIQASDPKVGVVVHTYTLTITSGGNEGIYQITTSSSPAAGGTTTGGGILNNGDLATVVATANPGYCFESWSEGGVHVWFSPIYPFTVTGSRDLVANFKNANVGPNSYEVIFGFEFSGNLLSLLESDNNKLNIFPDDMTLIARIEISGVAPISNPAAIRFALESSVDRVGLVQSIGLLNYVTNTFTVVDGRVATTADSLVDLVVSNNAPDFVGPGGSMVTQITWQPINDEDPAQDGWIHSIDRIAWTMVL